jgi:hypothetical protein
MSGARDVFASAAHTFARLVQVLPTDSFARPGLGEWDLRALVGHTSRSLITVSTYLQTPASTADLTGPVEYYAAGRPDATWDPIRRPRWTRWRAGPSMTSTRRAIR